MKDYIPFLLALSGLACIVVAAATTIGFRPSLRERTRERRLRHRTFILVAAGMLQLLGGGAIVLLGMAT